MKNKAKEILKKVMAAAMAGMVLASSAIGAAGETYYPEEDVSSAEHPNHSYDFGYAETKYVIDTNQKGILHIQKSVNDRSEASDIDPGIGSTAGEQNQEQMEQLGDVTYTIYRVADIVQGHLDATGTQVSLEYRSLIQDSTQQHNTIPIPSGLHSAQELEEWVADLRDAEEPSRRMGNLNELPHWSGTTDAKGNVTFDGDGAGLPLGVYVIYEAAYPSQVTDPSPFVVTLPTTAVEGEKAGVYWIYDVQAHPKNAVKDLTIEKHIIADQGEATRYEVQDGVNDPSNDTLTDTEDYEIGDTIRYWVKAEVPATIGELEYYYILDRMSIGQTFVNDVASGNRMAQMEVWGRNLDGDMVYIPRYQGTTENYRVVSADEIANDTNTNSYTDMYGNPMTIREAAWEEAYAYENAFEVLFNPVALSEDQNYDGTTKRVPLYSEIYVTYHMTLNEKAIVGNPGNVNDIALVVSHVTTDNLYEISNEPHNPGDQFKPFENPSIHGVDVINPQCIDTRIYTYAVRVKKVGEGNEDMTGAEFELRDSKGNQVHVLQYRDAEALNKADLTDRVGDYYVVQDASEGSDTIRIDEDQEICIYGLGSGTYQLVETKTRSGYQLLREPIVLTIVSDSDIEAQPMHYQEDASGSYFKIEAGKGYYINQDNRKLKIDVSGHQAGDFVAVDGEVYCYELSGDDGSMTKGAGPVQNRYSYRWTDSESMEFHSNYGMDASGVVSLQVFNRHGFNIPSAGGSGTMIYVGIGLALVGAGLVACYLVLCQRKKQSW